MGPLLSPDRRWRGSAATSLISLFLAACAGDPVARQDVAGYSGSYGDLRPRILRADRRLQCVPYARRVSRIQIRGDAWTWWDKAAKRYRRGRRPREGAVLVLRRKRGGLGHVAVVSRILGPREIVVRHANWLNQGRIHLDTPVRDESPANDWSVVRVWYTPGNHYGGSTYPAYGFIYRRVDTAARLGGAGRPQPGAG